jgi:hypothetical protein
MWHSCSIRERAWKTNRNRLVQLLKRRYSILFMETPPYNSGSPRGEQLALPLLPTPTLALRGSDHCQLDTLWVHAVHRVIVFIDDHALSNLPIELLAEIVPYPGPHTPIICRDVPWVHPDGGTARVGDPRRSVHRIREIL